MLQKFVAPEAVVLSEAMIRHYAVRDPSAQSALADLEVLTDLLNGEKFRITRSRGFCRLRDNSSVSHATFGT